MSRKHLRIATITSLAFTFAACSTSPSVHAQEGPLTPQPLPEHAILKKDVGTWDASIKSWQQPDAEPIESKGSEKNEMLSGDMWLLSRFEGSFGPFKFVGVGSLGYDPVQKKYIGTWIDNMSPFLMITKADYDAATKTMTGIGESHNPETNEVMKTKSIARYIDDNTRTFAMYTTGADGKEWKMLEITYKRRAQ